MLCKKPFQNFGCGQCLPCRINRRRVWTHRMMLEAYKHGDSCFVTLTYAPWCVPEGGNLVPKDVQLWLKRFREQFAPKKIRFYLVGEYGDDSQRPHYHVAIFGVGSYCKKVVCRTWSMGLVHVGQLTPESAGYICGYVTKKMTSKVDPRLNGRVPEFSRMSNRPGVGAHAMKDVASALLSLPQIGSVVGAIGDVPSVLRHGNKKLPLGRYLSRRLRYEMGFGSMAPREDVFKIKRLEMQGLREESFSKAEKEGVSVFEIEKQARDQRILNVESLYKSKVSRKSI